MDTWNPQRVPNLSLIAMILGQVHMRIVLDSFVECCRSCPKTQRGGYVLELGGTLRVVHPDFQERLAELQAKSRFAETTGIADLFTPTLRII
jgi:hypothetical protein